ncbi:cyclodeaminase/cyclohydrolase family protein [Paenibacillus tarimensis]
MNVYDLTFRELLEKAGSSSPTPGGGTIAALAAALGASMGAMAANLTMGPKYEVVRERMRNVADTMTAANDDFERIAHQDMEVFNSYMSSLGMPKGTDEEKRARTLALQTAAQQAADVPLCLMRRCLQLMNDLDGAADQVNSNVSSDLGIALLMLDAAVQSAWITAEINIYSLNDVVLLKRYEEEGTVLARQSEDTKRMVMQRIRERIVR